MELSKQTVVYYDYLDSLRESGATNMFGAGAYLQRDFDLSRRESKDVLMQWMKWRTQHG